MYSAYTNENFHSISLSTIFFPIGMVVVFPHSAALSPDFTIHISKNEKMRVEHYICEPEKPINVSHLITNPVEKNA